MILNKIQLGDMMTELPLLGEEFADCLVTDPPYKIITGGNCNGANSIRPKGILSENHQLFQTKITPYDWFPIVYKALKPNAHAYIFTNALNMETMLNAARKSGFHLHNILVWEKNNCTPSQYYMKNCEYVLFLRKGQAKYINNIGLSKTVHQFDNIIGHKRHPTEKPIALLKFYIANSTNEGDIVLDPFAGSGSTMEAAIELKRNFVGFEIDPKYIR